MNQEEMLLIDRYLENALTGYELKKFLDRLESDEEFRKEVSFHNLLIEGIQEADDNRIKQLIEKQIDYKRPLVPFALKLIVTFFIITVSGIVLWNYVDTGSSGVRRKYFSLEFLRNAKLNKQAPAVEEKLLKNKKPVKKDITVVTDTTTINHDENPVITDSVKSGITDAEDIIVKKDQLLISLNIKSKEIGKQISKVENTVSNSSKNIVNKLNPGGDLPEESVTSGETFYVEFWISPVNYKGYKLINNKLILFGIEEPDAVRLFSDESKLWMKYGKDYYSLMPTENFEALVQSYEFPSALK
jgi:hypothetical protein